MKLLHLAEWIGTRTVEALLYNNIGVKENINRAVAFRRLRLADFQRAGSALAGRLFPARPLSNRHILVRCDQARLIGGFLAYGGARRVAV